MQKSHQKALKVICAKRNEFDAFYRSIVQQLAMYYGEAENITKKKQDIYENAANEIRNIYDYDDIKIPMFAMNITEIELDRKVKQFIERIDTSISALESIFKDAERKVLARRSKLDSDLSLAQQATRQHQFFLEFSNPKDFAIDFRHKSNKSIIDLSAEIRLKPDKKVNSNGNSIGTQIIRIPHIDVKKLHLLEGFSFVYGNEQCIYNFDSGKEIKINAYTRTEAIKTVNRLLKVIKPERRKGHAADHCSIKSTGKIIELTGVKAKLIDVYVCFYTGERRRYLFDKKTIDCSENFAGS
jgi:hypothetical protein